MVDEAKNKLKSFKLNKKTELLIALVLALVVLVIFIKTIKASDEPMLEEEKSEEITDIQYGYEEKVEDRLKNIIASIQGVEQAKVFVMTESSPKIVYAYDEEVRVSGTDSVVTQTDRVIVFNKDGSKTEAIKSIEIYPEIKGVLIVAKGANDEKLRLMILNAVSVALDLENSKIEVLPG